MSRTQKKAASSPARPVDRAAEMAEGIRAAGLKLTPQRLAIVRELASDPTHPTAQELYDRLKEELPMMSFATVYNTLDALATAGLCSAMSLAPGAARFDPNMAAHHHAICDRCGQVRDVPISAGTASGPTGDESSGRSKPLAGFEVRAVERIYRGVCASCARTRVEHRP